MWFGTVQNERCNNSPARWSDRERTQILSPNTRPHAPALDVLQALQGLLPGEASSTHHILGRLRGVFIQSRARRHLLLLRLEKFS